jgi:hypothetical protein
VPGLHADFYQACFCQCQYMHKNGSAAGLVKDRHPHSVDANPPPLGWGYGNCPYKYCCLNKECPQTMYIRHRSPRSNIQPSSQCSGEDTFIVDAKGGLQGVDQGFLRDFKKTGYP